MVEMINEIFVAIILRIPSIIVIGLLIYFWLHDRKMWRDTEIEEKQAEKINDPDYKKALRELNKEFPGIKQKVEKWVR